MNPNFAIPQNTPNTDLLIEILRDANTPEFLEVLAADHFSEKKEIIDSIFNTAATLPPALEEQKESGSLEAVDQSQGPTIQNLIALLLKDKTVDVNAKDSTGWPLIFFAVENVTVLEMLFQARPELANTFSTITGIARDGSNSITWDIFTWAAEKRDTKSLTVLLNQLPVEAVQAKKEEIIRWFLAKDLTQAHIQENFLAVLNAFALPAAEMNAFLVEAVNANAPLAIRVLLQADNADVNAVDRDGMTALRLAARYGYADAITALLAAPGINVNAFDHDGLTALMLAVLGGHADAITALLAAPGINVNAVDRLGRAALMLAALHGRAYALTTLLAAPGINVNAVDYNGKTALMLAARYGYADAITALLAVPAFDLTLHNQARAAIALAERKSHPECAQPIQAALDAAEARILQPPAPVPAQSQPEELESRAPTLRFSQAAGNPVAEATNRSVPSMPTQNPRL